MREADIAGLRSLISQLRLGLVSSRKNSTKHTVLVELDSPISIDVSEDSKILASFNGATKILVSVDDRLGTGLTFKRLL